MSTIASGQAGTLASSLQATAPAPQAAVIPAASKEIKVSRTTATLFALLLFGLGWGFGYGVVTRVWPAPNSDAARGSQTAALDAKYDLIKNGLDTAAENAKRLDRLLTFLVTITTLYALALGLNSYFGLKQIIETGKQDLSQLKEFVTVSESTITKRLATAESDLAEFRKQIGAKYPEMADMHENLRTLVSDIDSAFAADRNWTTEYGELTAQQREQIALAELRIHSVELFHLTHAQFRGEVQNIYRSLARFYSSKYLAQGSPDDWERASIYFDKAKAIDLEKMPVQLRVEYGIHLTAMESRLAQNRTPPPDDPSLLKRLRDQAERELRTIRSADGGVLGASYNLAWVISRQILHGEKPKEKYQECIDLYSEVINAQNADKELLRKYLVDAWVNRAGCQALRASDTDGTDRDYDGALSDLEESKKAAQQFGQLVQWAAGVRREADSGDFQKLNLHRGQKLLDLLQ